MSAVRAPEDAEVRATTRRRAIVGGLICAAVTGAIALVAGGAMPGGHGEHRYRVDAIFDVARGIGPRQVVKIAGAPVGTVVSVRLTPDAKARVQLRIDRRFAPFHADASCAIRPEGLISENFVDCRPGTPAAPVLEATGDQAPTVAVERTSAPVSLQDLLDVWRTPTADRLAVLVDKLGLGVAGRGADLNAILYRANPTLAAARKAIAVVNGQRRQLEHLFDTAAPVVERLAAHDADVQRFISQTARVTAITGAHRDDLSAAIARLPPLLKAAVPALRQLDAAATQTTPLLRDAQAAAPRLARLTADLPPFARTTSAALRRLDPSLRTAGTALTRARPVLRQLATFATAADPAGRDLARLLVSLRDSGGVESLLHGFYAVAGLTNRFDSTSHILLGNILINQCVVYARTPTAGCSARLDGTTTHGSPTTVPPAATSTTAARQPIAPSPAKPSAPASPTAAAAPAEPAPRPLIPGLPALPAPNVTQTVTDLLDYLLG